MATNKNAELYLQWDILYKNVKTKKQRDNVVKELLDNIKGEVKPGDDSVPLKYEIFKSESNKLLYVLRIFKQIRNVQNGKVPALSAMDVNPNDSPTNLSGPILPSGPKIPPPPGVASIIATNMMI